jgi:hypothetical protein
MEEEARKSIVLYKTSDQLEKFTYKKPGAPQQNGTPA